MKMPVRIIDTDFNLLGEINEYTSLIINRKWHGVGMLELRVNRHAVGAEHLKKGLILFPFDNTHKVFVIRHMEIELDERGRITENWFIRAPHIKSMAQKRLTIPEEGQTHDEFKGHAAEVMKMLFDRHLVNPTNPDRKFPFVSVTDEVFKLGDKEEPFEWQSRFKEVAEELEEIGLITGIGWTVNLDFSQRKMVFSPRIGKDRGYNQSENSPMLFSPEWKTLHTLSFTDSDLDYKNVAIVAGQGEGVDRKTTTVGEAKGVDRFEMFVDARDVENEVRPEEGDPYPRPEEDIIADLKKRGEQKLEERKQVLHMEGKALPHESFVYEKDWDLGDIVTVRDLEWGVTMDARITEVNEVYEGGRPPVIEPIFGNDKPTLLNQIKRELSAFNNEIKK